MDWDRLKAKDLLALFNSFTPKGGTVFSVKVRNSWFLKGVLAFTVKKNRLQNKGSQCWFSETNTEVLSSSRRSLHFLD